MTNSTCNQQLLKEVGQGLSAMYHWYSSSDLEALQVLLCIRMLADERGYAQLVDVRREVGIVPDRMTRCIRLLQGQKKSLSFLTTGEDARIPLIDIAFYDGSPNVKRLALTPKGRDIVAQVINPVVSRYERIESLERKLELKEKQLKAEIESTKSALNVFEEFGINSNIIGSHHSQNAVFFQGTCSLIKALLQDVRSMSPDELRSLNLPLLNQHIQALPDEKSLGFKLAYLRAMVAE